MKGSHEGCREVESGAVYLKSFLCIEEAGMSSVALRESMVVRMGALFFGLSPLGSLLMIEGVFLRYASLDSDKFCPIMYTELPKGSKVFEKFVGVFNRVTLLRGQLIIFFYPYLSWECGASLLTGGVYRL